MLKQDSVDVVTIHLPTPGISGKRQSSVSVPPSFLLGEYVLLAT